MNTAVNELLTPTQAAEILAVSVKTLNNWRCRNDPSIEYVKVGRCVRYRKSALDAYITNNITGGVR
jgi:excisionase family DNA binding protein